MFYVDGEAVIGDEVRRWHFVIVQCAQEIVTLHFVLCGKPCVQAESLRREVERLQSELSAVGSELADAHAGKAKYKTRYLELKEENAEDEQKRRAQQSLPFHSGAPSSSWLTSQL